MEARQDPDRSELVWLGVAQERAACAELVRAAGCLCEGLIRAKLSVRLKEGCHDPRCPQALAAAIEARGR